MAGLPLAVLCIPGCRGSGPPLPRPRSTGSVVPSATAPCPVSTRFRSRLDTGAAAGGLRALERARSEQAEAVLSPLRASHSEISPPF